MKAGQFDCTYPDDDRHHRFGPFPMALGLGEGAEIRTPMAIAVISGLLTSTFLTLLIIPTIYYLFALAQERWFVAADDPSES